MEFSEIHYFNSETAADLHIDGTQHFHLEELMYFGSI